MTARETRRADELHTDDVIVWRGDREAMGPFGLLKLVQPAPQPGFTFIADSLSRSVQVPSGRLVELATTEEVQAYGRAADRAAFATTLREFARIVVQHALPVPPHGGPIRIGFEVEHDDDVRMWADYLSSRSRPSYSRLTVTAEAEGVLVEVRGPERCDGCGVAPHDGLCDPAVIQEDAQAARIGTVAQVFGPMYADKPAEEFGPDNLDDLVDAALSGSKPALQELATGPYGFAPPGGHKTAAAEDAYRTDRYSGEG